MRKPRGKPFAKGQSGNPGGRRAVPEEVKAFFEGHTLEAAEKLVLCMRSGDPDMSFKAAMAILDRSLGKPAQALEVSGPDGDPLKVALATELSASTPDELVGALKQLKAQRAKE